MNPLKPDSKPRFMFQPYKAGVIFTIDQKRCPLPLFFSAEEGVETASCCLKADGIFSFQAVNPWLVSSRDHDRSLSSNTLAASGIYIPVVWGVCSGLHSACTGAVDEVTLLGLHPRDWQLVDNQLTDAGNPAFQRRIICRQGTPYGT